MDLYNIWLSMVLGSCPSNGGEIVFCGADPQELYQNRHAWHKYGVFSNKQMERALEVPLERAQQVQKEHIKHDILSLNYCDKDYPCCYQHLDQSPVILFYKGDIKLIEWGNRIGVVGSRNPDRDGTKICTDMCEAWAQQGITIVSGLAQGMDSIGHRAALENGAKTVAFIGTSLDKAYPASHKALQNEICEKGLVVSEYYVGAPTPAVTFIERNRLIAASCQILCVMQAKEKSGTLSTAKRAVEYCRSLFVVPGSVLNPLYDGSNKLIQMGAYPLLRPEDVLERLGIDTKPKKKKEKRAKLSDVERKIYDALGRETKSTNQLFTETKIPIVQLKALLTKMELDGVIKSVSPGVYCTK